jgi:hypothetical protein
MHTLLTWGNYKLHTTNVPAIIMHNDAVRLSHRYCMTNTSRKLGRGQNIELLFVAQGFSPHSMPLKE